MKRIASEPGSLEDERRSARLAYIAARARRKAAERALSTLPPGATAEAIQMATKALAVAEDELSAAAWRVTDAFAEQPPGPSEPEAFPPLPSGRDRKQ